MAYFKYNKEGQDKHTQGEFEPFLNVPKERRLALDAKKDGDYRYRLMPPWSQEGAFAFSSILHFGVGLKKKTVVCPNTVGDDLCPFCRVHQQIKGDKMFAADSDAVRPSFRYFSNAVDLKLPVDRAEVSVWSYGPQIYFPIKKIQDSGEYGDITDPEEGRDLIINRQVRGKVTDAVTPAGRPSMIGNPDWLDQLFDLNALLPEVDVAAVEQLFKSHLWKVYEPGVSVGVWQQEEQSTPKEDIREKLKAKMQKATPNPEPKQEDAPKQPEQVSDTQTQVGDVAARLRAKLAAAKQATN